MTTKAVNKVSGKDSTVAYAFNEMNWGEDSREYLDDIQGLRDASIAEIVEKAKGIASRRIRSISRVTTIDDQGSRRQRRRLVDVPDNSENCTFQSSDY